MTKVMDFNVLLREEVKAIFLEEIKDTTKEESEIFKLLSVFTAYNITKDIVEKNFKYKTRDEIVETLFNSLLKKGSTKEMETWNLIIDILGEGKIFHIIDNVKDYSYVYREINHRIEKARINALEIFTRTSRDKFLN